MDKEQKIFGEFQEVDCNQCERYYLNQCDGAKCSNKVQKVPCNSFLATRSVVIPKQIEKLNKSVKRLKFCVNGLCVTMLLLCLYLIWR